MKNILLMVVTVATSLVSFSVIAGSRDGVNNWEKVKSYCQRGAINNQDRAHKPVVTCNYSKSGGSYKEKTIKTVLVEKDIVDDTIGNFNSTFYTDKSKQANSYQQDIYVAGRSNKDNVLPSIQEDCKSTTYEEKISFEYGRADTCKLMRDQPTPKSFCDYIYNNVLDTQEKEKYTLRDVKLDKVCTTSSKP